MFASLFKEATISIPVGRLGGHSIVFKAPGMARDESHSVYYTLGDGLSPEAYYRPNGEIYLAGVNSSTIPLPSLATDATPFDDSLKKLKQIARELIASDSELEVVREGLCFRPITDRGTPFIARLTDEQLGGGISTRLGQEGGVFLAAGHGPWGISLSLGTGKVVAEMMQGKDPSVDISQLGF